MLVSSSFRNFLIAAGVGLLVLGAARIYVSESRHLDDPQPQYLRDTASADGGISLNRLEGELLEAAYWLTNPQQGQPSSREQSNRKTALGWGIASLVFGSTVFVGALLAKTP